VTTSEPDPLAGIDSVVRTGIARVPIRMRESGTTMSGWRLSVTSAQGPGSIDVVDGQAGAVLYRGEGIFLGWTQARLAAAHARLIPPAPDPEQSSGQWG
jgi:hypothetical protein